MLDPARAKAASSPVSLSKRRDSLRWRLSLAFALFLALNLLLGGFAIYELHNVNQVSSVIRDRWLQSVRVLGDLNNFTSDFRAAEATSILATTPDEIQQAKSGVDLLDRQVAAAEAEYMGIPHGAEEGERYRQFVRQWAAYRIEAAEVMQSEHGERTKVRAFLAKSQNSYGRASDTLGLLTSLTVARAAAASNDAAITYGRARLLILLTLGIGVGMLALALNYIRARISDPLTRLAAIMRQLAANDTSVQIDHLGRPDEIGDMTRAVAIFRDNAVALARSQKALVAQARQLEGHLERERRLTALHRDFVSMASHEFRTPLNIIDGQAQRLNKLRGQIAPEDIGERALAIRRAVQRITQVMDRLLSVSSAETPAEGMAIRCERIDLNALVDEVVRAHRESAPTAKIIADLDVTPAIAEADSALLFQAFSNVIANALKYSGAAPVVRVMARREGDRFVVTIADRGIGIPREDLGEIFELHRRGGNVAEAPGAGVGLYFVRTVLRQHGGEVRAESAPGEGATFTIALPVETSQ